MKKIKIINSYKYLLAIVGGLIISSCGEELNEPTLIEPSHRVVYTSQVDFNNTIEVGGDITFGDVSRGVVSRTWEFPSSASMNANTSDAIIKAVFNQPGTFDVTLNQTFKEDAFDIESSNTIGKEIDTTFVITVLEEIKATFKANYINDDGTLGDELIIADNALNEVTAGKSIRFTNVSTGVPANFDWEIEGGSTSNETLTGEIDAQYSIFNEEYDVTFAATRVRPFGGDTLVVKNLIKTIPSTEPLVLNKLTDKDGKIALEFSRAILDSSVDIADYSVTIVNNGTTIPSNILSAEVDSEQQNLLLLELDGENIYNDDEITVAYTAGSLFTTDGVAADSFNSNTLIFNTVNIIESSGTDYDYSFEGTTNSNWVFSGWDPPFNEYDLTVTTDQAQDGLSSALVKMQSGVGTIFTNRNATGDFKTIPVETGKAYEIGMWSYVTTDLSAIGTGEKPAWRFFWFPGVDWGVGDVVVYDSDFPTNEWVYSSTFVTFSEAGDIRFEIRGFNAPSNPNDLEVYIDNISVSEVTLRP